LKFKIKYRDLIADQFQKKRKLVLWSECVPQSSYVGN
jgi:hypothetical protein